MSSPIGTAHRPVVETTVWSAARRFPTGVSVVTVGSGDAVHGSTVSAFSFVSHEPPLISVCLQNDSSLLPRITQHRDFTVNVLAAHQSALARHFASRSKSPGRAQFQGVQWTPGEGGVPRLRSALSWLHCRVHECVPAGDHMVVLATVTACAAESDGAPLLYFAGHLHPGHIRIEEETT
ncbi:flavin reductase family protein [Streptomyces sp. NPDC101194]|uniref:flavin reductase family protein n=1 Tax=Streptomyces sp. NPDC101194 TaxID=3366127 RepID=UPI003825B3AA